MLTRIKNYLYRKGILRVSQKQLPPTFTLDKDAVLNIGSVNSTVNIHGVDSQPILTIENDGSLTWHRPDKVDEAARMLSDSLAMTNERKAGIKYSRTQWEKDILDDLVSVARTNNGVISETDLYRTFSKRQMITILKGKQV